MGATPIDLDLNPAGTRLWIATSGASSVSYLDLAGKKSGTVALQHPPVAVAVGGNGKVYAVNNAGNIEIVNETSQTWIAEVIWELEDQIISPSFIEIDQSANLLYVANTGISPSTVKHHRVV